MGTGYDPEVWAGTKRLAEPLRAPVAIGSIVWEKIADEANHDARGGVVIKLRVDDDGEQVVTVLRARQQADKFVVYTTDLNSSDLNGLAIEPPSKRRLHRAARQVFRFLGEHQDAYITGRSRWLMEVGVGLVLTGDELERGEQ